MHIHVYIYRYVYIYTCICKHVFTCVGIIKKLYANRNSDTPRLGIFLIVFHVTRNKT